ncbi:hypothetical protein ACFY20_08895 [Streptomyces sp. NPDC001312]|uniref:hypothetical protein n=1 Tax=Streptomyces sp. NPDC001312 TaxID=3364561 RepID=UPI0036BB8C79
MRRFILPIAAILLTAACGSSTGHNSPTKPTQATTAPAHSASAAAKPKASHSTKQCSPTRDVIVWTRAEGLPDNAQVLGNYQLATCETTFKWLQRTSPAEVGDCTEAAWASDNPGYNADAIPAKRLKKVQMAVGPAC